MQANLVVEGLQYAADLGANELNGGPQGWLFAPVFAHHTDSAFTHSVSKTVCFFAYGAIFSNRGASSKPEAIASRAVASRRSPNLKALDFLEHGLVCPHDPPLICPTAEIQLKFGAFTGLSQGTNHLK